MPESVCYLIDRKTNMKKIIALLVVLIFVSCKEEVVKKPSRLIEKGVMVNIMYDLTILEAMKYQNSVVSDSVMINPSQYIFKKYKIDSLQFVKSNVYYASHYEEYKDMYEQISSRLAKEKEVNDALIKAEKKKKQADKKKTIPASKPADSLKPSGR